VKIPGIDIDFSVELQAIRFTQPISPVGFGAQTSHVSADATNKMWADPQGRFLVVVRILSTQDQKAEYTLVPFANVAFFRVKVPAAAVKKDGAR
jgi:hypothetical protein